MWVREENGSPVEVILAPRMIVTGPVGNQVRHPVALFRVWSDAERATIGIFSASVDGSGDSFLKRRTGSVHSWSKQKVGGSYVITPSYENLSRAEVRQLIRLEAQSRIVAELPEKGNGGALEAFRMACRTRAQELLQAFDDTVTFNIRTGSINGSGGWPT